MRLQGEAGVEAGVEAGAGQSPASVVQSGASCGGGVCPEPSGFLEGGQGGAEGVGGGNPE